LWVSLIASCEAPEYASSSPHRALDHRRRHEVAGRQAQVAVVLRHAGVEHARPRAAIEAGEDVLVEGPRDLEGPVAAEVEEQDRGAVADRPDRALPVGDDEAGQVLVVEAGLVVERGDRHAGAREPAALAAHVDRPAARDDVPVGLVAVHRHDHATAAAGDAIVAAVGREGGERGLEAVDVKQRGAAGDVAAVDQHVHAGRLDALGRGALQHRDQVIDVAVDVAVRQQADEVECFARR
jgi:hypothetical protein